VCAGAVGWWCESTVSGQFSHPGHNSITCTMKHDCPALLGVSILLASPALAFQVRFESFDCWGNALTYDPANTPLIGQNGEPQITGGSPLVSISLPTLNGPTSGTVLPVGERLVQPDPR